MANSLSIYIHYPFCKSKCPYCDFNSHVRDNINHEHFLAAYFAEIEFFFTKLGKREVSTIFFGGGTPSLMPIFLVEGILQKIAKTFTIASDCEISLEANPTSFESAKFTNFRDVGINRLSLGIQALNDFDLNFLGREHSAVEALKTIENAAKIFANFSFDLIYARPNQTLKNWEKELLSAISFGTKHLSLYQLTIEKGTKFYSQFKRGDFVLPDENLAAEFYELTNEITAKNQLQLYEISNYAKSGFQCRHNLAYWQGQDYAGIGAGAHSRVYFVGQKKRLAISMLHEPNSWLKKVQELGAGIQQIAEIDEKELLEELILMALRLPQGIENKTLQQHFGKDLQQIFSQKKLQKLIMQNLIIFEPEALKIPDNKRLLTNLIITKICENL